jgi:DNA-directed RNA polymerase subunit F
MAFTFNGTTKTITLSLGTVSFSTVDRYSSWKLWWVTDDNAKYLPAFKVVGGDPTSGGNSITPYFFLDNGWKVRPQEANHTLDINGILITIDNSDPFTDTIGNWRIVIKNVVPIYAENTSAVISGDVNIDTTQIATDIWSYNNRTLTVTTGLTSTQEAKLDAIKARTDKLTFDNTNHLLSYLDDKTGYTLTYDDKLLLANIVEQEIINEADAEKVLTAITDKIASVNPNLGDITTSSIASAVWGYVNRGLTVASGLTVEQNQLLEDIASNSAVTRKSITNKVSIFPQADGDIIVVYDEDGVTPIFRTHVSTDKTQRIRLVN